MPQLKHFLANCSSGVRLQFRSPVLILLVLWPFLNCGDSTTWYRGNTHAHTKICGHADSSPETVVQWYHDRGYNFLILSEHNHFIDPDSVMMPANQRDDFILIPGEEISGPGAVHTTAMNIRHLVPWDFRHEHKSEIIQNHVHGTVAAGGQAIINHPNYLYAISAADILPVKQLYMMELYNGHPLVNLYGDAEHPPVEEMWDTLLTRGMTIYGVSSDDAHHFAKSDTMSSNPGRGWVMVRARELKEDAITDAMVRGDFFASNGVMLSTCSRSQTEYKIVVDEKRTARELAMPELRGKRVSAGPEGYLIEFIGPQGLVLSATRGTAATYRTKKSDTFVRARVTLRRCHQKGGLEEFYAWGQPVFATRTEN